MAVKKRSQKQLVRAAVEAHSDLNIFAAVVAILEGGTMSADAQPDGFLSLWNETGVKLERMGAKPFKKRVAQQEQAP